MTASALRTALAASLASQLGTYAIPGTTTTKPAIYIGEPPNDWIATGLECRIEPIPDMQQTPAYVTGAVRDTWRVRLITHGNTSLVKHATAVRKVLSRWSTAQARYIPANEELAIPAQHTITIPT